MGFQEWGNEHWKVTVKDDEYRIKAPGTQYVFNEHDFLVLVHELNSVAEDIFEKEEWFVHDGNIINRHTGEQLIGVTEDCWKLNELTKKINELECKIELLQNTLDMRNGERVELE